MGCEPRRDPFGGDLEKPCCFGYPRGMAAQRTQPRRVSRTQAFIGILLAVASLLPAAVRAQEAPPGPEAQSAPAAEPAPAPVAEPAPAPQPQAAPSDAPPPPPPPPPPARSGDYGGRAEPDYGYQEREPEPRYQEPEADDYGDDSEPREFSIRLDPFNWLIEGRLGIELEMTAWKFISVEMVPILVANDTPPTINFGEFSDSLTQHSNGVGPFSGASIGAGFWLGGEPFRGYVLRAIFTNYGYEYKAEDAAGVYDRVSFTERRFVGFFGSHSRWGIFTIAGGFGLGYELNSQERCGLTTVTTAGGDEKIAGRSVDCRGSQKIAVKRDLSEQVDLNGSLHPVYLEARFSLGFVF